jgi:DNA-binding MarR family transcriptional regulator
MAPEETGLYFTLFNEIGIIGQLSRTLLEARLPEGLLAPHFTVLNHLIRMGDGRTPLDLARAFQVPKTSLTHTLAGLERRGLVALRPNPGDGRSKQVWITAEGRALRDSVIAAMEPAIAAIAPGFPPDRVEAILPALTALRRILDAQRDAPGG